MQLSIKKVPASKTVAEIEGTRYRILADGSVVSTLRPTVINGKTYYNLTLEKKLKRFSAAYLKTLSK